MTTRKKNKEVCEVCILANIKKFTLILPKWIVTHIKAPGNVIYLFFAKKMWKLFSYLEGKLFISTLWPLILAEKVGTLGAVPKKRRGHNEKRSLFCYSRLCVNVEPLIRSDSLPSILNINSGKSVS